MLYIETISICDHNTYIWTGTLIINGTLLLSREYVENVYQYLLIVVLLLEWPSIIPF